MSITINVTQTDIERGERHCPHACPVALAVRRATNQGCEVYGDVIIVGAVSYLTPDRADDFIGDFDDGAPVAPFDFTLAEVVHLD